MSNAYNIFIFYLIVAMTYIIAQEIDIPTGLRMNDLIEWKGVISTKKEPAQFYLFSPLLQKNGYTALKMEIHGARNRLAFTYGIPGRESFSTSRYKYCNEDKNVVGPGLPFRVIIRVVSREYMVFWNGKLIFTMPIINNAQGSHRIRKVEVHGSAKTDELRILTDRQLAEELQDSQCGKITSGKAIPNFCPSTRSDCRIVDGGPAIPGQVPWQAAIRRKKVTGNQDYHVCGATLISKCWALTAGHCFSSASLRSLQNYVLRVGDYYNKDNSPNSKDNRAEDSQDLEIEKVIRHQNLQHYPVPQNDIALVKLKRCATYNDFVKPACLPKTSTQRIDGTKQRCGVSGWGATNSTQHHSQYPACLQSASVQVKSTSFCSNAYGDSFQQDIVFCASGSRCADTCQGDSGGPLVCAFGAKPRYILWGITSWGRNCGEVGSPGVYTRLTSYIRWLYLNMKLYPDDLTLRDLTVAQNAERHFCIFPKAS